jgi:O-antigen ligase
MALLQAVAIGLIALIVTPGYLFYFDVTPKVVVLLAGTALALVWGAGRRPAHRWFSLLLLLNLISLGLSTALSAQPALAAFGTNWRRFGAAPQAAVLLFAWLVSQHVSGRPDRVRTILRGVAASGAVTAIYGIAQYFGWDPFLPAAAYHIGEGIWTIVRPPGTLGYVSYFATWLLSVSFLSLALCAMESSVAWRRIGFAAAGLAAIAMLLTGTRAAVLGLVAGVAVWLYRSGFRVTRRMAAGAAVLVFAAGAFYFSPFGWKMRSRTRWFIEDPWGGARPALWRDSLRMGAARLPAGYGPEVFTAAFPRFESKALARAYPDFLHESPHNIFLDALVAQGLPGLVILCGLCAMGLKRAREPAAVWIGAGLAAGLVAQQFTVFTVPTAVMFYVTVALAVGLSGRQARQSASGPGAGGQTRQSASGPGDGLARARVGREAIWVRVAVAPVALALVYLAVRFTVADGELALARRELESGQLQAAATHYARYERWRPPGTSADLWYSRTLLNLALKAPHPVVRFQAFAQAGAAGERATQLAEDPCDAWYSMAEIYAAQNDAGKTESSLRAAIAASPNWFKPHWALAQVLRLESRMDDAEYEAALAADLDGGKHPEVARTLAEIRAQRAAGRPPDQQR